MTVTSLLCSFDDCELPTYAKGFCNTHYQLAARNGELQDDRTVLKLKAELARHGAARPANHYRAGCATCRLIDWLAGEGEGRVQQVRSYQSHGRHV